MELTWIDDFIVLSRTKNFTKAAALRCTTQSAFSRRIQSMEDWIGTPLFHRDTRPTTLTMAGEECKKRIEILRTDIMDLKRIANLATTNLKESACLIYTTNTISIGILPRWVKEKGLSHYRLVVSSVTQGIEMVRDERCDYALLPRFDFLDNPILDRGKVIHKDRLVFAHSKDISINVTPDNVIEGNVLMYSPKTAFGQSIDKMMKHNGLRLSDNPVCESASAEALLAQIKSGLGAGWIVESLLKSDHDLIIRDDFPNIIFDVVEVIVR